MLGPTLFVYFINGMPEILASLRFLLMTLRSTLLCSQINIEGCCKNSIDQLVQWTITQYKDWQIKFINDQCKSLHIGQNNPEQIF